MNKLFFVISLLVVSLPVLANDGDIDSAINTGSVTIADSPAHGSVSVNAVGRVTYTPAANYNGADSFTYTIRDAESAASNEALVSITVSAVNDAPNIGNIPDQTINEGASFTTFDLDTFLTEVDGDAVTWTSTGNSQLTVSIGAGNVVTLNSTAGIPPCSTSPMTATTTFTQPVLSKSGFSWVAKT